MAFNLEQIPDEQSPEQTLNWNISGTLTIFMLWFSLIVSAVLLVMTTEYEFRSKAPLQLVQITPPFKEKNKNILVTITKGKTFSPATSRFIENLRSLHLFVGKFPSDLFSVRLTHYSAQLLSKPNEINLEGNLFNLNLTFLFSLISGKPWYTVQTQLLNTLKPTTIASRNFLRW